MATVSKFRWQSMCLVANFRYSLAAPKHFAFIKISPGGLSEAIRYEVADIMPEFIFWIVV